MIIAPAPADNPPKVRRTDIADRPSTFGGTVLMKDTSACAFLDVQGSLSEIPYSLHAEVFGLRRVPELPRAHGDLIRRNLNIVYLAMLAAFMFPPAMIL